MKCAVCKSIAECKRAFGKYWTDKSGDGDPNDPEACGCVLPDGHPWDADKNEEGDNE